MGCKKYDAKNEKNTLTDLIQISDENFLQLPLLLFYCYYSIRTIYFKLNGSFYTREGVKVY